MANFVVIVSVYLNTFIVSIIVGRGFFGFSVLFQNGRHIKVFRKKTRNAAAYEALNVRSLTCNFFLDANI